MLFSRILHILALALLTHGCSALSFGGKPNLIIKPYKRELLQDLVTWDEHSLFVRGERILFYSGEFHPFRLPVPGLWLDVFQKIKALGYSGVSFYTDWALLEGKPGDFSAEGIFALEPFFDAASQAGIYLLARPGPYINAEVSGGGYPGWLQRIKGQLRTSAPDYLHATDNYVQHIGEIIAKAQITSGGPVILLHPENEYSQAVTGVEFPNGEYMKYVENQYRKVGIVVPFINNDARPQGVFAPGNGTGSVDIYGYDGYPLGFDCAHPYTWPDGALLTNLLMLHLEQSPTTPHSIVEFQGGSFDPWGGLGFDRCSILLNEEFERVFYKNDFSVGVTIFNIYMTYGGTNWGNLGHPGGYTSYDYGAVIRENRVVDREKYSEAKLEANFLKASPAYLTATPGNVSNGSFVDTDALAVIRLVSDKTSFYVVRHAAYNTLASTNYKLSISASGGPVTVPQLGGTLTLNGRDSKFHVSDYDLDGVNLLYSSAEIFTWKKYGSKRILILYGGFNERHEAAISATGVVKAPEGSEVVVGRRDNVIFLNWEVTRSRKIIQIGSNLLIYLLWRNDVYNYWTLDLPGSSSNNFSTQSAKSVIVKAGYLLRTASISGTSLHLTGDLNRTTSIEVIGGAPATCSSVTFNGKQLSVSRTSLGTIKATVPYNAPKFTVPTLKELEWKYLDSLPEIQHDYDDSKWTDADLTSTNNPRNLTTPTSLYASDYGYNTGNILLRGHFTAMGKESTMFLEPQGGDAFGVSYWLNSEFLGSWTGIAADQNYNQTLTLPNLKSGQAYVLTILLDNMGLDESGTVGTDEMKNPRGILRYDLSGRKSSAIKWKITGNLGGETYQDKARGPLNEGGLFAERQGYHLPNPPSQKWPTAKPTDGISKAGVGFYTTSFDLDMPAGFDIPMSFVFTNTTTVSNYRSLLYVNGYQFGKYVNNIGPQTSFPVPEGILNYHGTNYIALSLWALDSAGTKVEDIKLVAGPVIQSAYSAPELVPMLAWEERQGAY